MSGSSGTRRPLALAASDTVPTLNRKPTDGQSVEASDTTRLVP